MVRDDFSKCDSNVRLDGKVALVAGATSGLGFETAKNFASRGAKVIIASRNPEKLEKARIDLVKSSKNENIYTKQVNFESLSSIRNLVRETYLSEPALDILVNNVGTIGLEDKLTVDGLHVMMQVNYFGAFLLTFLLFPLLKASAPSRVINVSSSGLLLGDINLEHMNDVGRYFDFGFYCNAKLAVVLFSIEMNKRVKDSGVQVFSMDPGLIKTKFFRNYDDGFWKTVLNGALAIFGRPAHRVATLPVYLASDSKLDSLNSRHFRDCVSFYSTWYANDTVLTKRLWKKSKELVKITPTEDWES
ncbi:unnamed protein product [Leptosia nina]|uniref:Uncharacterized protein n=1 Tax=Leptosia nina TaxID=320188 RepID=A0AAV1J0U7_9NEOP